MGFLPARAFAVQGTTVPTPSPSPSTPAKKECGAFDIGCKIGEGIDDWFRNLAKSALKPVFDNLGQTLLSTPQVEEIPRVEQIWTTTLIIANTAFVLFVIAGGLILMGYETFQTSYTVKDIAPRLVIGIVGANFSAMFAGKAIEMANALALALLGDGVDAKTAGKMLRDRLSSELDVGSVFLVLVVLVAIVFALVLAIVYVIRLTLTILLVAIAPLALACHALPQTEEWARLWWRLLAGVLFIQVAQSLVFITALKVMLTPAGPINNGSQGWDLLIIICLLYILIRIPSWIMHQVMQSGGSPIAQVTRLVIYRRFLAGAIRSGSRGRKRS